MAKKETTTTKTFLFMGTECTEVDGKIVTVNEATVGKDLDTELEDADY